MKNRLTVNAILISVVTVLLLSACATSESVSYLLDMEYGQSDTAHYAPDLRLQKSDVLDIRVFADNPELTKPFFQSSADGMVREFEIDSLGFIDFPVLGKIAVEGLTLKELETDMEQRVRETGYIKEPVVQAELKNFTVTVIGAAGNKTIQISDEKFNLIHLLAATGALGANCNLRDVMVIRTENGLRKPYKVNLQTKALYDSPVFYLRQNDVIYFKSKGWTMTPTGSTLISIFSPGLSMASVITNIILWTRR